MRETNEILLILSQKKELFQQFAVQADEICQVPMEEMEEHMAKRQEIIEKLQELDKQMEALCESAGQGTDDAVHNRCDRSGLTPELGMIFDASMAVKAIVSRIVAFEPMVKDRIETEKELLMEKIESINTGALAAAKRYSPTMQVSMDKPLARRDLGKA